MQTLLILALGSGTLASSFALPAKSYPPLEAELVRSLAGDRVKVGDEILAKIRTEWTDGVCTLPTASLIHGRIERTNPPSSAREIAIAFQYQCHDQVKKLFWLALLAPEPADEGNLVLRQSRHSASFGEGGGLGRAGNTQGDLQHGVLDLSGRQNPSLPVFTESNRDRRDKRPQQVKIGQVWKLPRLQLSVGTGLGESTVVYTKDSHLHLPSGSMLVLLSEAAAVRPVLAVQLKSNVGVTKVEAVRLPPDIAPCKSPSCTLVPDLLMQSWNAELESSLHLEGIGYRRLKAAELRGLEYGAACAFLGDDQLLFTFNPKPVILRDGADRPEERPHMIRAALFDLKSATILRTLDWRLDSDRQYLWVIDGGPLLVRDGGRLRWFGKDLEEIQSLRLEGPFAWLRISPDRKHYMIAVTQELHTTEEHAGLMEGSASAPEERVKVQTFDENLKQLGSDEAGSRDLPPELLDTGILEVHRVKADTYYLRLSPWNAGLPSKDFARM